MFSSPLPKDAAALIESLQAADPQQVAVEVKGRTLTYSELAAMLQALKGRLGNLSGMRLLLLLPDSMETYLIHLFAFLSGSALIPVSTQSGPQQLKRIVERTEPDLIFTTELLRQRHEDLFATIASVTFTVSKDPLEDLLSISFHSSRTIPALPVLSKRAPEKIRVIIFTSGSTGAPKGVCLDESNIVAAAAMMVEFLSLDSRRISLVTVPLYDYYGLIQIYGHILCGGTCVLGETSAIPQRLIQRLNVGDVTDLVLVPYTLRYLFRVAKDRFTLCLRSIKVITSSSDALSEDVLRATFEANDDISVFNIYGLTEAGRAAYRKIVSTSPFSRSIGRASREVEILVEGSEGSPGEIVIRGPNVMRGYLLEIRSERIVYSPCQQIHTKDLGYVDENGDIILVGRQDHMMNINGMKMHPAEIEELALQLPTVVEASAFAFVTPGGSKAVGLDVVLADDSADTANILAHLRKSVPTAFVPASIRVVPAIVRTELGSKIVRHII